MGQERFEEGTGIYGFIIEYDVSALFVEEPKAETIHQYKDHINEFGFIDTEERVISKEQAIALLVKYIKEPKPRCGLIFVDEDIDIKKSSNTREKDGRLKKGNKNASKLVDMESEVYLLYMLCGNMNEAAALLGVSRQTVSRNVKKFKEHLKI